MSRTLKIAFRFTVSCAALFFSSSCGKKTLKPSNITASSILPRTPNYTYEPERLADGNPNTTWAEGQPGDGIGEFVLFRFNDLQSIMSVKIINGFPVMHPQLGDLYYLNNRVKKARIEFDDGIEQFTLDDNEKTSQTIRFAQSHKSKTARLVIEAVYPGSKWKDTCISELQFIGTKDASGPSDTSSLERRWVIRDSFYNAHPMEGDQYDKIDPRTGAGVTYTNRPQKYTKSECEQTIAEESSAILRKSTANDKKMKENQRFGKPVDENLPYPEAVGPDEGGPGDSVCISL